MEIRGQARVSYLGGADGIATMGAEEWQESVRCCELVWCALGCPVTCAAAVRRDTLGKMRPGLRWTGCAYRRGVHRVHTQ